MRRALVLLVGLVMAAATACGDPSGLSAQNQELAAYLSSMYRVQGDQLAATADIALGPEALDASTQEELLAQSRGVNEQLAALLEQYLADLKAIDPPERAADFHASLIESGELVGDDTLAFLDDLASGDPELTVQAQQRQAALFETILGDTQGIAAELADIVGEALAGRDDPESVYILETLALVNEAGLATAQELIGAFETNPSTPAGLNDIIEQVIGVFETARADHTAIIPPDVWAELHAERTAIFDDGIDLYSRFGAVMSGLFEDPESADQDEFEQVFKDLLDWTGRSPAWSAAFSYQLADYFEELA